VIQKDETKVHTPRVLTPVSLYVSCVSKDDAGDCSEGQEARLQLPPETGLVRTPLARFPGDVALR